MLSPTSCPLRLLALVAALAPAAHGAQLSDVVAQSHSDDQATGPVQAILSHGVLHVRFQNTSIDESTGAEIYGSGGKLLDTLTAFARTNVTTGRRRLLAARGLELPTGVAVSSGRIYLSIDGLSTGGGKIVSLEDGS